MDIRPLAIEGAFEITPQQFADDRGLFAEGFRADFLAQAMGHEMKVLQTNVSLSVSGALRGIHYAVGHPSQAKYVTAINGVFLDFIIDVRVGSPTFGKWECVRLDTVERRSVYVPEGLGHALACLQAGAAVYLCSEVFTPSIERGLTPLDPRIGLGLPDGFRPVLSPRDAVAPSLEEAAEAGLLPMFEECRAYVRSLQEGHR